MHDSRSAYAVIRVYDEAGTVDREARARGDFKSGEFFKSSHFARVYVGLAANRDEPATDDQCHAHYDEQRRRPMPNGPVD